MFKKIRLLALTLMAAISMTSIAFAGFISREEAVNIALQRVPGATAANVYDVHKDQEHGRMIYEGKIYFDNTKYEFEIDAETGKIIDWEEKHRSPFNK